MFVFVLEELHGWVVGSPGVGMQGGRQVEGVLALALFGLLLNRLFNSIGFGFALLALMEELAVLLFEAGPELIEFALLLEDLLELLLILLLLLPEPIFGGAQLPPLLLELALGPFQGGLALVAVEPGLGHVLLRPASKLEVLLPDPDEVGEAVHGLVVFGGVAHRAQGHAPGLQHAVHVLQQIVEGLRVGVLVEVRRRRRVDRREVLRQRVRQKVVLRPGG